MKTLNVLYFITLATILISCGSNQEQKKSYFSLVTENNQTKFNIGEQLKITVKPISEYQLDSVTFLLDQKRVATNTTGVYEKSLVSEKLGKHILTAQVYYNGNIDSITKKLTILNDKAPKIYSYKIIAEYPHDAKAYTQGLEFVGDTLYENTGKNGQSSLRKIDYTTGNVLQKTDLDESYFGEGITVLNNKIYQLTWLSKQGFIYDLNTFKNIGSFGYNKSKEGWGLCNDGNVIYKSDGTEKIWFLDSNTLIEKGYIQIATHKSVKSKFNELEWVDGKIYANTYQKDGIAIINPENGALEAVINLKGLREKATPAGKEKDADYVLNGIAYKPETKQLFVTGKYWDKLFEIEVIK